MQVISSIAGLRRALARPRLAGKRIGFVPTMGYFHEGHLSLMRLARKGSDIVVVSIFVNPLQFGAGEDFERYPRDLSRDIVMARQAGVDIVFTPRASEMYRDGAITRIVVDGVEGHLCGRFRPGHFSGVATVVCKLLNIVSPDSMYLGQKDAQQVWVLQRMVRDLDLPVKIKVCPIVREADGLAMSSRNALLSPSERALAPAIFRALSGAKKDIARGVLDARKIISRIKMLLGDGMNDSICMKVDYVECVDVGSLVPVSKIKRDVMIAIAVWIGRTRLIDNIVVKQ